MPTCILCLARGPACTYACVYDCYAGRQAGEQADAISGGLTLDHLGDQVGSQAGGGRRADWAACREYAGKINKILARISL